MRWTGHVARMEEGRSALKILTGKPIGKVKLICYSSASGLCGYTVLEERVYLSFQELS